jgi:DNA invertase Pin-like site-specific DNA recombinase
MTDGNLSPEEMEEIAHKYLSEKTKAGLAKARAAGVHIGKPAAVIDFSEIKSAMNKYNTSERQAVKILRIPLSTYYPYKIAHKDRAIAAGLTFGRKEKIKSDPVEV